jgi:hypothetical protein
VVFPVSASSSPRLIVSTKTLCVPGALKGGDSARGEAVSSFVLELVYRTTTTQHGPKDRREERKGSRPTHGEEAC